MIVFTAKQKEAERLAKSKARFILFRGGSRSGKTFATLAFILQRALIAPGSRHGIFRQIGNDARRTIFDLTLRQVFEARVPGLWLKLKEEKKINEVEMTVELPNGALIIVGGLDDAARQERILGDEYSTVFVNEISQFRTFDVFQKIIGRLSLEKEIVLDDKPTGRLLTPKLFLDCNPPKTKRHWSFDAFMRGVNPISQEPWPRPDEWVQIQMNPADNAENISSTYLADLENLSASDRRRFAEGEWGTDNENGMFKAVWWQGEGVHRRLPKLAPGEREFDLIAVCVDPAGTATAGSDETGIIVVARSEAEEGREPEAFVLADYSGKMSPKDWGQKALDVRTLWGADVIIVERNSDYTKDTITSLDAAAPVIEGKHKGRDKPTRALPVAGLYEAGRIHHCGGALTKLEEQLEEFHIDWSRTKDGSPDRLDALVYGIEHLLILPKERNGGEQSRFDLFS